MEPVAALSSVQIRVKAYCILIHLRVNIGSFGSGERLKKGGMVNFSLLINSVRYIL